MTKRVMHIDKKTKTKKHQTNPPTQPTKQKQKPTKSNITKSLESFRGLQEYIAVSVNNSD